MYEELVSHLRECAKLDPSENTFAEAADAIEDLRNKLQDSEDDNINLTGWLAEEHAKHLWIPIESRPMDEEERRYYSDHYGYNLTDDEAVIYCCQLPEHGQEVLVCSKWGHIWIDTFDDDPDYGVGFETNGDMDGLVAWMPLPTLQDQTFGNDSDNCQKSKEDE